VVPVGLVDGVVGIMIGEVAVIVAPVVGVLVVLLGAVRVVVTLVVARGIFFVPVLAFAAMLLRPALAHLGPAIEVLPATSTATEVAAATSVAVRCPAQSDD
jgi:hypothetical protein